MNERCREKLYILRSEYLNKTSTGGSGYFGTNHCLALSTSLSHYEFFVNDYNAEGVEYLDKALWPPNIPKLLDTQYSGLTPRPRFIAIASRELLKSVRWEGKPLTATNAADSVKEIAEYVNGLEAKPHITAEDFLTAIFLRFSNMMLVSSLPEKNNTRIEKQAEAYFVLQRTIMDIGSKFKGQNKEVRDRLGVKVLGSYYAEIEKKEEWELMNLIVERPSEFVANLFRVYQQEVIHG